jgi:hypothetical protein
MTTQGDAEKQPPECRALGKFKMDCPNLKEVYSGFDGERYRCDVCGESFFFSYDDVA